MASLPLESAIPLRAATARLGVGTAMFAAFLLYCEMHALVGWETVPLIVSTRWAVAATLVWGLLALAAWEFRHRLRAAAAGAPRDKARFLLALAAAIVGADLVAMELTTLLNEQKPLADPVRRAYQFAPRAAMLAGLVLLALMLWERRIAPPRAAAMPEDWLDFPEAPLLRLRAADVVMIRSAGNYSEIVNGTRSYLVRTTLSDLAERLAPHGFVRIHRCTLVNARHVREACRDGAGRAIVRLAGGATLPVGRSYLDRLGDITRGG